MGCKSETDQISHNKLSTLEAGVALMNGCLGTTILYISHIFSSVQYNFVTFAIIGMVSVVVTGIYVILSVCKIRCEAKEYYELVHKSIHPYMEYFTMFYSMLYVFETCVAYLIIIKEQLSYSLVKSFFISSSKNVSHINIDNLILLILIIFIVPPLISRNLWFMTYSSMINLISAIYIMIFLILEFFKQRFILNNTCSIHTTPKYNSSSNADYLQTTISAICAIIFGYRNHIPSVSIFEAMSHQTFYNFFEVTVVSVSFTSIVYCVSGYFGYATFCESTKVDILLNYSEPSYVVTCTRLAAASILATSYVMSAFSSRIALHKVIDWILYGILENHCKTHIKSYNKIISKQSEKDTLNTCNRLEKLIPNYSSVSWIATGILWFLATYYVSSKFRNGSPVVTFLGGSSCFFSFIIPGICLIKMVDDTSNLSKKNKTILKTIGFSYTFLGALILSYSLVSTASHIIRR